MYFHWFLFMSCILLRGLAQEPRFHSQELPDDRLGSRGVSIADLDGNGLLDIAIANETDSTRLLGNTLYFNQGGSFTKVPVAENNAGAWSEAVHTLDIDNDGDLDLFFATQFNNPNLLYRNDGKGNFTRVMSGDLPKDPTNSPGACACDFDRDGDLDLFVVNRDGADDILYLNDGQGLYTRARTGPWIGNKGDGRSCAWGDLNGDGRPDLYVANFVHKTGGRVTGKHRNYLYMSTADGSYTEQRTGLPVEEEQATYGVNFIDVDYDGDLDIYVTNVSVADENAFYRNMGNGKFEKETESVIAHEVHRPSKGQTWGDFNLDGLLDLYIANGTEGYPEIQNFFFLGSPGHSFRRVYNTLPAVDAHISAGTASGDLDGDGDLDLYVCNWGGNAEANDLYINDSPPGHWVKFRLKGIHSNSYGIGSWVRLVLDDGSVQTRYFSRCTGYGSEDAPEIHFGIPAATYIKALEVEWPSGQIQEITGPGLDTSYEIIEGQGIKNIAP